jgi:hypothetical protein
MPVPRAHQIAADVLARSDQVAQCLHRAGRDPDRVQPADHQQPHQTLGVTAIGLDAILGGPLDLARRRDDAPDPGRLQRPGQPEPGRPDSPSTVTATTFAACTSSQPNCEPSPWSVPPMRLWAPRGVPPARLTHHPAISVARNRPYLPPGPDITGP